MGKKCTLTGLPWLANVVGQESESYSDFNRRANAEFVSRLGRPPTTEELFILQWNWERSL